jgi:hypothetical protein
MFSLIGSGRRPSDDRATGGTDERATHRKLSRGSGCRLQWLMPCLGSPATWPQGDPYRSAVPGRPASFVTQLRARDGRAGGRRADFHAGDGHRHLGEARGTHACDRCFRLRVLLMVIIWAAWIDPIHETVNSWRPESLPPNWAELNGGTLSTRSGLSCLPLPPAIGGLLV